MNTVPPVPINVLIGRLLLAVAFGAAIGWDRERAEKAAGLRTNMLVSLGSAMFILVPIQIGAIASDVTILGRSLQGIVTGVGFIGAGSILREQRVQGLTSAAAIWITAALGMAAGLGLWQLGVLGLTFAITILRLVKLLEDRFL